MFVKYETNFLCSSRMVNTAVPAVFEDQLTIDIPKKFSSESTVPLTNLANTEF